MSAVRREDSLVRNFSCSPPPSPTDQPVIRFVRAFSQGRFPEPYPRGATPNPLFADPVTSQDKPRKWKVFSSKQGWRIFKIFNKIGIGAGVASAGVGSPRL